MIGKNLDLGAKNQDHRNTRMNMKKRLESQYAGDK
jgi:hypothetical protein